jgi:uncharacterized protein (DUF4415 family)
MPVKKDITFIEEIIEEPQKDNKDAALSVTFEEDDFSGILFEEISESEASEAPAMPTATAAPAPVQVIQQSSRTEEMLFELLDKFRYETMVSEIRRTVRAEMEREAIKFRLDSGLKRYREQGGKVGRKVGSIKTREQKQDEYAKVLRCLKQGKSIRDTSVLCGVSVSTVFRVKREFGV